MEKKGGRGRGQCRPAEEGESESVHQHCQQRMTTYDDDDDVCTRGSKNAVLAKTPVYPLPLLSHTPPLLPAPLFFFYHFYASDPFDPQSTEYRVRRNAPYLFP